MKYSWIFCKVFATILFLSGQLTEVANGSKLERNIEREIPSMTVAELVDYWGYQFEQHHVVTSDGYILGVHRIPGVKGELQTETQKPVVLLGHGMLSSSLQWIFGPSYNSMGYALADAGYDVWMVNTRGNTYSKNHTTFDTCSDCPDFWSFGFHEGGTKDFPAIIDYVLETTGEQDLFYVGHSMGTTQYLILLSELPEYNDKIKAGFLLAPAAFMTHATDPIFLISQFAEEIDDLYHLFGSYEFLPHPDVISDLGHLYCDVEEHPIYAEICANIAFILFNIAPDHLNITMIPVYLDNHPAGSSTRPLVHYAQLNDAKDHFVNYDFGSAEENLDHYGVESPPEYDLTRVTAKTALYLGDMDSTATIPDGEHLRDVLPNVIKFEVLRDCSHMDFAIAVQAREQIYDQILQVMAEIQTQTIHL